MQKTKIEYISQSDQQKMMAYFNWPDNAKILVFILHGMVEHQARYAKLVNCLNDENIATLTVDHRGHGESLFGGTLKGHFADEDGWQRNVDDLHGLLQLVLLKSKFKVVMFGHSMGSLLARSYLQKYESNIDALYLSGSPALNPMSKMGLVLAKTIRLVYGKRHQSPLMTKLSLGSFNKGIVNPSTFWDWLSMDSVNVQSYIQDPLCGFDLTAQGFIDMLHGVDQVYSTQGWKIKNPTLAIKFESGQEDPCCLPGGLEKAVDVLKEIGYQNVEFNYVDGCRHEIYNDIKQAQLRSSLVLWISKVIK
jgi:alpha-beta hydrolase superfamily lysophospholipase